eukprot:923877_1
MLPYFIHVLAYDVFVDLDEMYILGTFVFCVVCNVSVKTSLSYCSATLFMVLSSVVYSSFLSLVVVLVCMGCVVVTYPLNGVSYKFVCYHITIIWCIQYDIGVLDIESRISQFVTFMIFFMDAPIELWRFHYGIRSILRSSHHQIGVFSWAIIKLVNVIVDEPLILTSHSLSHILFKKEYVVIISLI